MNNYRYLKDLYSYKKWKNKEEKLQKYRHSFFSSYGLLIVFGITLLSAIFGTIIIYSNLLEINVISIFPNLLSNSYIFSSITISTMLLLIVIMFFFFGVAYILRDLINKKVFFIERCFYIVIYICLLLLLVITTLLFLYYLNLKINNVIVVVYLIFIFTFCICFIINEIINFFLKRSCDLKKSCIESFHIQVIIQFLIFPFYNVSHFLDISIQYYMIISLLIFLYEIYIYKVKVIDVNVYIMSTIFLFVLMMMFQIVPKLNYPDVKSKSISEVSLELLNIRETSDKSKWYLLDKNFIEKKYSYIDKNGIFHIDIERVKKLKNKFGNQKNTYNVNQGKSEDYKLNTNLYGYFAWNLGKKKVFCPSNISIEKIKDNMKGNQHPCLLIEGKYLTQSLN
ncbi:hypothetical protein QJU89_06800 [Pasteurella skyensis]|uniref:Uncharacterized protein n=1 Tax=Phocoenobacter skyensis TaxID=97481 RepID=A0AAJ6N9E5_9PAST|nr:hypothetical protein [Pasteurella skyensis]MDP8162180.1 hypothetical protein [Pasteurella skyensis]MDP8172644.1 hypothetical protein [Pasteurella skyensis]MDP8176806.1 hypothetical protein [Pasteurella skyensis]MDP8179144.1 hypothetical protein [Pasteurella skyensis]MDP8183401.1 hypothetical protein [Pasteurella skyensis]